MEDKRNHKISLLKEYEDLLNHNGLAFETSQSCNIAKKVIDKVIANSSEIIYDRYIMNLIPNNVALQTKEVADTVLTMELIEHDN